MSGLFTLYGIGQGTFPVLPPPKPYSTIPVTNNGDIAIGQLAYVGTSGAYAFYIYDGAGVWNLLAGATGNIISVLGTANQITASAPVAGVITLSLPTTLIAPGSLEVTSGFTVDAGTTSLLGTVNINNSGAGNTIIGTGGTGFVHIGNATGNTTVTGSLTSSGTITATNGNLVLGTAGNKIDIATGTNASVGVTAAMSGSPGAVTVASTAVTTSSIILYSRATTGGTEGNVAITAQSAGSFTLTSTGNETSTFNYLIIN